MGSFTDRETKYPKVRSVFLLFSQVGSTRADALGAILVPLPVGGKHQDSVGLLPHANLGP